MNLNGKLWKKLDCISGIINFVIFRARSVYERGLNIDSTTQTIWLKYAEMEMKNKNVNHARNIFDRAVALLPRVDTFWYKYTYMEEMVIKFYPFNFFNLFLNVFSSLIMFLELDKFSNVGCNGNQLRMHGWRM